MGDHSPCYRTPRSQTLDLPSIFGIAKNKSLKDIGKVYKSLMTRRHYDKSSAEEKKTVEAPTTPPSFEHMGQKSESIFLSSKFLSRTVSRRSKTPSPRQTPSMSRNVSRRCTTPTPLSRSTSQRPASETEGAAASLSRNMSRMGKSITRTASTLSKKTSRRGTSETEICNPVASPNDMSRMSSPETEIPVDSLSKSSSRRSTTPIIFSQSIARRKPPPTEKKLECTLEDLCFGCVKKIKLTRDVIKHPGIIVKEEEILHVEVKPGWREGTKITFEGKGDEKPGYFPADIVFLISEKPHPLFSRDGDNLEIGIEIPLVNALTGFTIPVPLVGGEKMTLSFEDTIIYPGYEKVIRGQGMPNPKQDGRRGDIHIKFLIRFPIELSDEQREEAVSFLQDCY